MAEFTFAELDTAIQNATRTLETSSDERRRARAQQAIDAARRLRVQLAAQEGRGQTLGRLTGSETISQTEGTLQGFADLGIGLATGARTVGNFIGAQLGELAPGEQAGVGQSGGIGQRLRESLAAARGTTQQIRETAPVAEIAGEIAGLGGVVRRGSQLLGRAPQAIRGLFGRVQGQPVRNVARAAATGGAAGGAAAASQAASEGRDPAEAGSAGAAIGTAAGPVAAGVANLGVRAIQRLAGSDAAGFRLLARIADEPAETLQQRVEEFRNSARRDPTLLEIVDRSTAEQVGNIGRLRPRAGQIIRDAAENIRLQRQETLPEALTGSRVQTTAGRQEARRTASINRQFADIADIPVAVTRDVEDFLKSPDVEAIIRSRAISPGRRLRILGAVDGENPLTARDLEEIRRAAADAAGNQSGDFRNVANRARELLGNQIPEAEQALLEQATRGERITGVQAGQRVLQPEGAEDLADILSPRTPFGAQRGAGARAGARRALSRRAGESARGAESLSVSLATDRGVRNRIQQIFSADEAARIQRAGELEAGSVQNLQTATPGGLLVEPGPLENAVENIGGIAGLASGRGSAGFGLNVIERALSGLRIPPFASRRLAEALVDPNRTQEAIGVLRRLGAGEDTLSQIVNAAALAGGVGSQQMNR